MHIDDYQCRAIETAVYPGQRRFMGLTYCSLKLNGEAGEVAEKVGKAWRDDGGEITLERREAILKELGDVLWYVANIANELSVNLSVVAEMNITKLADRKERGVLQGSGDQR